MEKILENIIAIREKHGFSQENLAESLGMAQGSYSLIESGKRELKFRTLSKIADVLETSIHDIIAFPDIMIAKNAISTSVEQKNVKVLIEIEVEAKEMLNFNLKDKINQIINK